MRLLRWIAFSLQKENTKSSHRVVTRKTVVALHCVNWIVFCFSTSLCKLIFFLTTLHANRALRSIHVYIGSLCGCCGTIPLLLVKRKPYTAFEQE